MLLGQYCRNRKEVQKSREKKSRHLISNLRNARKGITDDPLPEGEKSGAGGDLDIFGYEILYTGGGNETLDSLWALDKATLAALIDWNRVNLALVNQKLVIRRSVAFIVAFVAAIAKIREMHLLDKTRLLDDPALRSVLEVWKRILWDDAWKWVLVVVSYVFIELAVWRPRKSRLQEFGQMLSVAYSYVSRTPSAAEPSANDSQAVEGGRDSSEICVFAERVCDHRVRRSKGGRKN